MPDKANERPGLIDQEQSILVIVDIQGSLLAAMQPTDGFAMLRHTERLVRAADLLDIPVLVTEQYPKGLGLTDERISALLPQSALFFEKTAFSAWGNEGFIQALKNTGCRQVIVLGQETHVCVLQTAFDLLQHGYQVFVVDDAVCSRKEFDKTNALQRMRQAGIQIVCYESVLFEWLRDAAHSAFKAISASIR